MGVDHAFDRFYSVLHYAIGSLDSVQERLAGVVAGISHLERDSFPDDETWDRFQSFMNENTGRAAKIDEGGIKSRRSQMSNAEATKGLQKALGLFADIAEAYGRGHP